MRVDLKSFEIAKYYRVRAPKVRQGRGKEWRGPCPIHRGTRDSFAVNSQNGLWTCHSACGRGGSICDLEMELSPVRISIRRSLRCTRPSPPSGGLEDLHLQAAEHAQHTTKALACATRL